jgi:hypothetical protein
MRWAGNITHLGKMRNASNILVGKPEEKRPLEKPYVDEMIILERIFVKKGGDVEWKHLTKVVPVGSSCEHGNELSGSI